MAGIDFVEHYQILRRWREDHGGTEPPAPRDEPEEHRGSGKKLLWD